MTPMLPSYAFVSTKSSSEGVTAHRIAQDVQEDATHIHVAMRMTAAAAMRMRVTALVRLLIVTVMRMPIALVMTVRMIVIVPSRMRMRVVLIDVDQLARLRWRRRRTRASQVGRRIRVAIASPSLVTGIEADRPLRRPVTGSLCRSNNVGASLSRMDRYDVLVFA